MRDRNNNRVLSLEAVAQPRFPIWFNPETKRYTTEDHPFFVEARKAGFKCYVDHDASKLVRHIGSFEFSHDHVAACQEKENAREDDGAEEGEPSA